MSVNSVSISGNLTRDAELRMTSAGSPVVSFGVAVNERRKNPQGEWEDYANFVDCVMFGTSAEKLQPYLEKGVKVAVEGKLRFSSWERDGQKRSKLEVVVDEVDLMSRGASRGHVSTQDERNHSSRQHDASGDESLPQGTKGRDLFGEEAMLASMYDQDIPF